MKYLIVGLGNIGAEYAGTRHNIGFNVLDALAEASNAVFTTQRYGDVAEARYKGRILVLLKPSTYMNLSGKAVRYWMDTEKIPQENLLVISDDIALPFGTLRLRPKGSAGGHNGLKNISELLGTEEYARMRFGVGGDFPKGLIYAEYNINHDSIDVYTSAGYMLRIDCWEAEKDLKTTYGSECALTSLAVDEPLEYARLYLEGNLQMWVDAEDSLELY